MSIRAALCLLLLCSPICLTCALAYGQDQTAVAVTTEGKSFSELLPDSLGDYRATAPLVTVSRDDLNRLVGERSDIYKEYRVLSAGSRLYGQYRVEVFKTDDRSAAFGLFAFNSREPVEKGAKAETGSGSGFSTRGFFFWQESYFVNVSGQAGHLANGQLGGAKKAAAAVSRLLGPDDRPRETPFLLDNLPLENGTAPPARYVLGQKSLDAYVQHGSDVFDFRGEAEGAVARYPQGPAGSNASFQLVMVEYDTPQFALDELKKAQGFVASLSPAEQSSTIVKRVGNYIVEANGVTDRAAAELVIDSISYPYTVKMLRNPRSRDADPHFGQKTAQVLLSTIGIIILMAGAALAGGIAFGSIIFFRRRRQQQDIFTDAGGMLRLDIEPLGTGDHSLIAASHRALKGAGEQ